MKLGKSISPVKPKQDGFGMLSVLVGTVVLLGATVAVVATTRGSTLSTDSTAAQAAGVISQASSLVTAAELVSTRGAVPLTSVTFDTSSTTGLFSPTLTGLSPPPLLPQVMESNARGTRWQLGRAVAIKDFGQNTAAEVAFYLPGVSSSVCAAINRSMTGSVAMGTTADTESSVPPTSDGTVGTLQQLLGASSAVTLPIATSTVHPAGVATPPILAFTTSTVAGAVGCFRFPSGIYVVYAVAQTN
jgi:hypothetical protein